MKFRLTGFESSLAVLCSPKARVSDIQLPTSDEQWEKWYGLAVLNRIETQVFKGILKLKITVPTFILKKLKERTSFIIQQNTSRRNEALLLFQKLNSAQIPFLVLKGNAISNEVYGDLDYKQMNDFDLLFKKEHLNELLNVYSNLGLQTAASLSTDFRKQEKYSHHWPPFFSRNLNLFIGTHWNLVSPLTHVKIPEEMLWEKTETFCFDNQMLERLSNNNFLLHLCVHLSNFKLGLKELADLYNFIDHFDSKINWSHFLQMTIDAHAENRVYHALAIVDSLVEIPSVASFLGKLKFYVLASTQKEVQFRISPPVKTLYLRTGHISKIEKNFAYFSLSESPLEKAYFLSKMWKNYLLPPIRERFRLCHEMYQESLWAQFRVSCKSVAKISQSFIHEMGALIFIIVTIRHHTELIKVCWRKLSGKRCRTLEEKALELGLKTDSLKALSQLE